MIWGDQCHRVEWKGQTYGSDILALEFGQELAEAFLIGVNAYSTKEFRDIGRRWGGVASDLKEQVSGDVTHLQVKYPDKYWRSGRPWGTYV